MKLLLLFVIPIPVPLVKPLTGKFWYVVADIVDAVNVPLIIVLPLTCNFSDGDVVPIPTLPVESILILSVCWSVLKVMKPPVLSVLNEN